MNAFKNDLLVQDWGVVFKENYVDNAYNTLKKIFISLYEKNCPIIQYYRKQKYIDRPWITKGYTL